MTTPVGDVIAPGRGAAGAGLSFIDHDRQRYAAKVRLPQEGEILVGQYLEGGGTGMLGEFRIALQDLGHRGGGGLLQPQLCLFDDGAAAFTAFLALEEADLAAILAPVAGHEALSRRLLALGLRDASDTPLDVGTEAA
jgi:hypothetical protein